jgi:hypothetical protein
MQLRNTNMLDMKQDTTMPYACHVYQMRFERSFRPIVRFMQLCDLLLGFILLLLLFRLRQEFPLDPLLFPLAVPIFQ